MLEKRTINTNRNHTQTNHENNKFKWYVIETTGIHLVFTWAGNSIFLQPVAFRVECSIPDDDVTQHACAAVNVKFRKIATPRISLWKFSVPFGLEIRKTYSFILKLLKMPCVGCGKGELHLDQKESFPANEKKNNPDCKCTPEKCCENCKCQKPGQCGCNPSNASSSGGCCKKDGGDTAGGDAKSSCCGSKK